jgi:MYXO-CTERM domain-containing protein
VRTALVWSVALSVLLLEASLAHGFCRTTSTTETEPPGYNPAVSGCWTGGVPLAWGANRVPFAIAASASRQVSLADATRVADLAFNAWNSAACEGKAPSIQAYDDGPISVASGGGDALAGWASCSESASCNPTAHDVIVFDDDAWPYDDPVNTLALTTVTYGVDDGRIFEAYTEVNSAQHKLTTAEPPPTSGAGFDLQSILTHEAGHFLGIAHATDANAIMYAYYHPGAINLTADDIAAICTVYPPQSTRGGCACTTSGTSRGVPSIVVIALAGLCILLTRRRPTL